MNTWSCLIEQALERLLRESPMVACFDCGLEIEREIAEEEWYGKGDDFLCNVCMLEY
jgi:hypothetical protein